MSFLNFRKWFASAFKAKANNVVQDPEKKWYSLIWYVKLQNKGETMYMQPFRTKIMASSLKEAEDKVADFAINKLELIIMPEEQFIHTRLHKLRSFFADFSPRIKSLFDMLEKTHKL